MRKVLFVCEGTTEVFLLYKILNETEKLNVNDKLLYNGNLRISNIKRFITLFFYNSNKSLEIYIHNLEGKDKLERFSEEFINSREIDDIEKILFIMDSDYQKENYTGFDRTKEKIKNNIKKVNEENPDLKTGYFITPDNKNDGMTENLIIDSLNCTEIVEYIKNVIEEVKEFPKAEIKNKAKSTFLMITATQNPLRGSASAFLSSCYDKIDKENPKFKKISEFIKNNIK